MVIITSVSIGMITADMYNKKDKSTNNIHYSLLLLSRCIFSEKYELCELIKVHNTNICLWDRNIDLRDNGV